MTKTKKLFGLKAALEYHAWPREKVNLVPCDTLPQEYELGSAGESQYRSMWMGGCYVYHKQGYAVEHIQKHAGARGWVGDRVNIFYLRQTNKAIN